MKKSLALLALFCVAVFAQGEAPPVAAAEPVPPAVLNPCDYEKDKAKAIYDRCVNMNKISIEYNDCAKEYKEQKTKAEQVCQVDLAPAPVAAPAPAVQPKAAVPQAPKPVSLEQALRASGLSGVCVEDFVYVLEEDGFSMANLAKELPPAIAKVKLQMKSPFGKPKDGDITGVGLTVGCIKALPSSLPEIQSLLKNISKEAGLKFAVSAAESAVDSYSSIPSNVARESDSGGGTLKAVLSTGIIMSGLGAIIYGFMQDSEVSDSIKNRDIKSAEDAQKSRNASYGIGAGLLASGLGVVIFF